MDQKVRDFLNRETMSVLAIELSDGPHAAAMHFTPEADLSAIYFLTRKESKKVTASFPAKASLVVGFSETDWETLQMSGMVVKVDMGEAKDKIVAKYPKDAEHIGDHSVFLKFTPTWWRYTDFNTHPKTVLEGVL